MANEMSGMEQSVPQALELKIRNVPPRPGVYLMKDEKGAVIYVGKA
ncbi:MAG TPA: hypothetical protein VLA94_04360 [Syntrophales bacterium]|nr:hypothetical protein [Syntrophales bacterium]